MRKYLAIFIVIIAILTTAFFYFEGKKPKVRRSDWQDETLLSQNCGLEGLKCCANGKAACDASLACCADPGGSGDNYCSSKCSFGEKGNFCRVGEQKCDADLACRGNRCLECGTAGAPCCLGSEKCKKNDVFRLECSIVGDSCEKCGARNSNACRVGAPCNKGNILNNNVCLPCGEYNTPCCNKTAGVDYECSPASRSACVLGFCN